MDTSVNASRLQSLLVGDGRTFGYSNLDKKNCPLTFIVWVAWDKGRSSDSEFLSRFDRMWNVYVEVLEGTHLSTFLGLENPTRLQRRLPHWCAVAPWDSRSFTQMYRWLPGRVRKNRLANGLKLPALVSRRTLMTLDSRLGGASHAKQYLSLLKSISSDGFWTKQNDSDPFRVTKLSAGSHSRWMVSSGSHRAICAAVLGLHEISGEVAREVRREDVDSWPNVENGNFRADQALALFDGLFDKRQLPLNHTLLERLRAVC